MAKIVAVANQKGGVGKTTTAVNLSAALALSGQKILLVDIDPQANATSGLGIERAPHTVYDCLFKEIPASDAIVTTAIAKLDLLPSDADLGGAEVELAQVDHREGRLRVLLSSVAQHYDFVILDCPPALGLLTINALTTADSVLVPVQCEYYAMEGLGRLMANIETVRGGLNKDLALEGILLTMCDTRLTLSRQVSEEVKKFFPDNVYRSTIPRNVALAEAPSYGRPGLLYNSASNGAKAYIEFAKEFMANGKESPGQGASNPSARE